jgi:hypothetical protein
MNAGPVPIETWPICLASLVALHFVVQSVSNSYPSFVKLDAKKKQVWIQNVICWLVSAALVACYAPLIWETHSTIEGRWTGTTHLGRLGHVLHICHSIYECVIYVITGKSFEFYLHHIVVLANYGMTLWFTQLQFWSSWDGMCEITNLSLCLLVLFNMTGSSQFYFR